MSRTVAVIGTGAMGRPMALRLLQAGHRLSVYDPRPQAVEPLVAAGARSAASPAHAAAEADVVFTCLPDGAALEEVYFGPQGLLAGPQRPGLVADLSTSGPEAARRMGEHLHAQGVDFLDAPVSGGVGRAAAGRLTVLVSGPAAAINTARSLFQTFGSDIFVVGAEPGQAQVLKLINNVLSYTALAATSEALVVARRAGVNLDVAVQALTQGTGRNSATDSKIPDHVLSRRFDYGAANRISHKDLSLYLDLAREMGVATPVTGLLFSLLQIWMPGRQDEDMTSISRLFEGWAGVELQGGAH